MGLQEELVYGLGTVGSALFGVLTFLYGNIPFGIIFGGLVTSTAGYFYQSRTWKRNVNREFAQKNVERMYQPLYKEVDTIVDRVTEANVVTGYAFLDGAQWNHTRSEYYHRYIPEPLKQQLMTFYVVVGRFNTLRQQVVDDILKPFIATKASKFFGVKCDGVYYAAKRGNLLIAQTDLLNPILFEKHPQDALKHMTPNAKDGEFYAKLSMVYPSGTNAVQELFNETDIEKFERFYKELASETSQLQAMKDFRQSYVDVLKVAPTIRDSLFQMIDKAR